VNEVIAGIDIGGSKLVTAKVCDFSIPLSTYKFGRSAAIVPNARHTASNVEMDRHCVRSLE
jgi:hypothetical protein